MAWCHQPSNSLESNKIVARRIISLVDNICISILFTLNFLQWSLAKCKSGIGLCNRFVSSKLSVETIGRSTLRMCPCNEILDYSTEASEENPFENAICRIGSNFPGANELITSQPSSVIITLIIPAKQITFHPSKPSWLSPMNFWPLPSWQPKCLRDISNNDKPLWLLAPLISYKLGYLCLWSTDDRHVGSFHKQDKWWLPYLS